MTHVTVYDRRSLAEEKKAEVEWTGEGRNEVTYRSVEILSAGGRSMQSDILRLKKRHIVLVYSWLNSVHFNLLCVLIFFLKRELSIARGEGEGGEGGGGP